MLGVFTEDGSGIRYRITDATGLKWSTHRGVSGGGFGYLKFTLPRKVGFDYTDIGLGYDITVFKSIGRILYHGQIRSIDESSSPGSDKIDVTALGYVVVAQDEEITRHFCDKRLNLWRPVSEIPRNLFRPDLYALGTNDIGFYIHPGEGKDISSGEYTEMVYEFGDDESAQRFKGTLSMVLGPGTVFDGTISSVDSVNGYVYYTDDSGESYVSEGMVLYNGTLGKQATVSSIDTSGNKITVSVAAEVSGWSASNEIAIYGPKFISNIDSITDATITYSESVLIGEANITLNGTLCNLSKKAIATIQSTDSGLNTITVSSAAHILGWDTGDLICEMAHYFSCQLQSKVGTTITYTNGVGERVASVTAGWAIHNVSQGQYATVQSWNIASSEFVVTASGDIGDWIGGDILRIHTPFKFGIYDTDDNPIWPTDWRQGAVAQNRTSIDVTTSGDPSGLKMRFSAYLSGSASATSFAQLTEVRAYSTTETVTATMLAKEIVGLLSVSGFGLSSSEADIYTSTKELEPMNFEFSTPAEAMQWACEYGDQNGNLLHWGVSLDEEKRFYLEVEDKSTILYVIPRGGPAEMSVTGDVDKSVQQVRAIYSDKLGKQQVTDWVSDTDSYFNGHYRRKSVKVDNIDTSADAIYVAGMYLSDNKSPKVSTRYTVGYGGVFNANKAPVEIDELQALNGVVIIQDWRGKETVVSSDTTNTWTKETISVVEIDYDSQRATLTPAESRNSFESYMAELSRIAEL